MKKLLQTVAVLGAIALPLMTAQAMPVAFVDGVHYKETPKRMAALSNEKNVIEVVEFFSYSCPHCFRLEPKVEQWKKSLPENVKFIQVPAIFRDSWLELAKVFYTAQATGDFEKLHPLLFKAIHVDKRKLVTEDQLLDFVAEQGIDREAFKKTMNSFAVKSKVKKALVLSQTSGITGVPAMIVGGQHRTDAPLAGGADEMLKAVNFLIQKQSAN